MTERTKDIDIKEDDICALAPELLSTLLKDHTLSTGDKQVNIFWATDNYADRGEGFQYSDQITIPCITGENGNVIVPRAVKSREQQQQRSRQMAEVFTPSWICNKQNNLIDAAWFGREDVFNTEVDNPDGSHSWVVNTEMITFPEDKTWKDYVRDNRLEITCGEAPYLVSRYDTVSGEPIPLERRIGLLDRKLRVVSENCDTTTEWLKWAQIAFQSIYGFEWQGDNLFLAREALLYTFIDYYRAKFGKDPLAKSLQYIAYIISWNIWQMDGLKGVIPGSCKLYKEEETQPMPSMIDVEPIPAPLTKLKSKSAKKKILCPGCAKNDYFGHNGVYCKIMDWAENKVITFKSIVQEGYVSNLRRQQDSR